MLINNVLTYFLVARKVTFWVPMNKQKNRYVEGYNCFIFKVSIPKNKYRAKQNHVANIGKYLIFEILPTSIVMFDYV